VLMNFSILAIILFFVSALIPGIISYFVGKTVDDGRIIWIVPSIIVFLSFGLGMASMEGAGNLIAEGVAFYLGIPTALSALIGGLIGRFQKRRKPRHE